MPSSSKGKAKYLGPRIHDYLDGLREEFELRSNLISTEGLRPSRFKVYLRALRGEFKLMAQEIESLREAQGEYSAKGTHLYPALPKYLAYL